MVQLQSSMHLTMFYKQKTKSVPHLPSPYVFRTMLGFFSHLMIGSPKKHSKHAKEQSYMLLQGYMHLVTPKTT